jgi:hypothetical protein
MEKYRDLLGKFGQIKKQEAADLDPVMQEELAKAAEDEKNYQYANIIGQRANQFSNIPTTWGIMTGKGLPGTDYTRGNEALKPAESKKDILDRFMKLKQQPIDLANKAELGVIEDVGNEERLALENQYKMDEMNARMAKESAGKEKENKGKEFDDTLKLKSAYQNAPAVKRFDQIAPAFSTIQNAVKKTSAANDIKLVFAYMKMVDPASSVKEGEVAMASQAQGVPSQVLNLYNRMVTGERMPPSVRNDFYQSAKQEFDSATKAKQLVDREFASTASYYGLNPSQVMSNYSVENFDPGKEEVIVRDPKTGQSGKVEKQHLDKFIKQGWEAVK